MRTKVGLGIHISEFQDVCVCVCVVCVCVLCVRACISVYTCACVCVKTKGQSPKGEFVCKLRVSFRSFCVFNISTVKRTHFVTVHVRKPAALSTCHITRFRLSERIYEALFDLKQTDCSVFQAAERRTQAPAGRNMQAERWRLTHLRPRA